MSRTRKDKPWRLLIDKPKERWRFKRGYPPIIGGAWEGVKEERKLHERSERRRVRDELKQGKEPAPTKHRNSGKWDLF
jgi:hypothetical protein